MAGSLDIRMKVISFCHYLQGPACSQYLADMGADVIKIEPLKGAFERHWSGGNSWVTDVSAFSLAVNRNKRSISIDLKSEEGLTLVRSLIAEADVVVENYRPGVLDRLGLGYEAVCAINPASSPLPAAVRRDPPWSAPPSLISMVDRCWRWAFSPLMSAGCKRVRGRVWNPVFSRRRSISRWRP